ncbi:adenylate/guanylate cyclase domain-containing protein [Acuticoccus sp. I52.16.1]|uniref:adenylate/guanylate cyclase domain-containing protein n=1 Tax=Acuticoccus sp. I52.16.1 TaxID=2928472 RepID=UPI001FD3F05A|nr:adenylate/guanylate cyclase domain-containing protein [Acuticoccus sp. I52.16.1]UOM33218.1 adenylate/guanylate cyclase domain-containing protein [Acuticoccus sp. I52.16.1]
MSLTECRVEVADLQVWLTEVALEAREIGTLLSELGERLNAAGLAISRLSLGWRALHPLTYANFVTWADDAPLEAGALSHVDAARRDGSNSVLRHIVENEIALYRVDLTAPAQPYDLLRELRDEGHSGYIGTTTKFGAAHVDHGVMRGVFFSFCTRAPTGFDDRTVDTMMALRPTLALAVRALIEMEASKALATTYLGRLAAERVLDGAIRRGDAEVIPAAIWYSDMRAFTPLAEELSLDETIAFLNEVFEATAGAVGDAGGHVLDFIGDAVLAIFPIEDDGVRRSLAALDDSLARLAEMRARILSRGGPLAMAASARAGIVGIALAVGDVRFGNIGTPRRLSFSVIGPTVNMVARIEALTKMLREPVLVSAPVADLAPGRFVLRGAFNLEGVRDRRALYGLAKRS